VDTSRHHEHDASAELHDSPRLSSFEPHDPQGLNPGNPGQGNEAGSMADSGAGGQVTVDIDELQLHSRLLAAVGEALIATDVQGRIIYWNRAAERLYGWPTDEVLGRNIVDLVPSEASVAQAAELMTQLSKGATWTGQFVVRRRDGTPFVATVTDTPVLDEAGALVGIIGVSSDLTESRRLDELAKRFAKLGSWEFDLAAGLPVWSDELRQIFGFAPDEPLPTPDRSLDLVHPDDRDWVRAKNLLLRPNDEPVETVHRIVRGDGEVRWVHSRSEIQFSDHGDATKAWGTVVDITDLKRTEVALQAAELRFGAAFERSPIGMALAEPSGRFLIANPALCYLLGQDQPRLLQLSVADVTHPDDVTSDIAAMSRMLADETESYQIEKRYVRPGGEVVWCLETVSMVRDPEGRPDYVFLQVQDLSERRGVEREATYRTARQAAFARLGLRSAGLGMSLEVLMDEAVAAVVSGLGLEGGAVFVVRSSDATAGEYPVGMIGMVGATQAAVSDAARGVDQGGSLVVAEWRHPTDFVPEPDLVERGLADRVSVVITVNSLTYGVLEVYTTPGRRLSAGDVSFVHSVAAVLGRTIERSGHDQHQRLAEVGQIAAGVAHDFNNVVAAISLYAELLQTQPSLDDAGREQLGVIRQQAERATAMVWQVLDSARRRALAVVEVDLAAFLAELGRLLRRMLPGEVTIGVADDGSGPFLVRADPTLLQQIFMNLAINANDAIVGPGEVHFRLFHDETTPARGVTSSIPVHRPWVRVEVADTGGGIPAGVLNRVFEPFFTTKAAGHGTGLGLALVRSMVAEQKGHIDIESSETTGTNVRIWLPCPT